MLLMALVLAVGAALICAVNVLNPQYLTPIVQKYANKALDARVSVSRVELSFEPSFPVLRVEVDSLTVVSKAFDGLDAEARAALPVWADSLFTIDRFGGSVDAGRFLSKGEIALRNIELVRPGVNIVLDRDGRGNFDIYSSAAPADTAATPQGAVVVPPFSLDHFAFVEPREIRYFNAVDSTSASILLLRDVSLDHVGEPVYRLSVSGSLSSPMTKTAINLEDIVFGVDGRMHWSPKRPMMMTFEEFSLYGAFLKATIDAGVDLDSTMQVTSARVRVAPIAVSDMLSVLPDSVRRANRLIAPYFRTDGAIGLEAELLRPYVPSRDTIPYARVNVSMDDCSLVYGNADFRQLGFDVTATLRGHDLDSATVELSRFEVAGPATHLKVKAAADNLRSDPVFEATLLGDVELAKLPPIGSRLIQGYVSGRLDLDVAARGRMSMLSPNRFHELDVNGEARLDKGYYLSADTAKMAEVGMLKLNFGSKERVYNTENGSMSAPFLQAKIALDTATILVNGVDISLADLSLGAGAMNTAPVADTTLVVPIGGGIKLGRLNIESVADSAGVHMTGLDGRLVLRRFKGLDRVPELVANLDLRRMTAGTMSTRLVLNRAHINASMHKLPHIVKMQQEIRRISDSIRSVRPDLSPDSVLRLAYEKRRHRPGQPRKRRVQATVDNDVEVIEWDLTKGFRRFLLGWQLNGNISTRHARMFTPYFPLRNRISRLDVDFSNDTISVKNLRYRAGSSDITVGGMVTNIKRALTSRRGNNSLKVNFKLVSDTIDVNQLSAAAFSGAAYSHRLANGGAAIQLNGDSDEVLDDRLDAMVSEQSDTVGPLLIPTNIDGQLSLKASNILYADMAMTGLTGDILLYDGGVNLHSLTASSDAGDLSLTALYSAPKVGDMHFGFGLNLERFNIERFLTLVPAVDSIMPLMRDFSGIINAEIAATVDVDSSMNMELPTLDAALRLTGDSLAFINPDTYATLGKWLRFRDRADNKIKHVSVEMIVRDNVLQIFPFSFDIDRYRLGVVGYNDLDLNFDYHIAVLKSPIPFKFGVTVKGNPDKFKVRFGGAKFKEGEVAESVNVVDTARVNLLRQLEGVFRRGVRSSRFAKLDVSAPDVKRRFTERDTTLSASDSLTLIREGILREE